MCKTAVDSLRLSILFPLRLLRLKPIFLKNYPVSFKSQILIMTISYNLMMSFGPRENFFSIIYGMEAVGGLRHSVNGKFNLNSVEKKKGRLLPL